MCRIHIAHSGTPAKATAPVGEQSMGETLLPFTQTRRTIADRMVKSKQTAAHVTTFFEADFSGIAKFREGRSLTYLPFVIRAVTRAIRDVPIVNSAWGNKGSSSRRIFMSVLLPLWRTGSWCRWCDMQIEKV